jgi:hypothetical protein
METGKVSRFIAFFPSAFLALAYPSKIPLLPGGSHLAEAAFEGKNKKAPHRRLCGIGAYLPSADGAMLISTLSHDFVFVNWIPCPIKGQLHPVSRVGPFEIYP